MLFCLDSKECPGNTCTRDHQRVPGVLLLGSKVADKQNKFASAALVYLFAMAALGVPCMRAEMQQSGNPLQEGIGSRRWQKKKRALDRSSGRAGPCVEF